jgi:hypothetical protein
MYIVFDLYTFDNMFCLLLKEGFDHEEVMDFMMAECSFSAVVFQERIHNRKCRRLRAKDAVNSEDAALKARMIYDLYYHWALSGNPAEGGADGAGMKVRSTRALTRRPGRTYKR